MTVEPHVTPIRPLLFTRTRLYLGGQAEYIAKVIDEELEASYRDLERLRAADGPDDEDSPEAQEIMSETERVKDEIRHLVAARRDISTGLLDERMEFLKVRVYRGGQADTLLAIFQDRQGDLLEQLAALRAAGRTEDDEEITEIRTRLVWLANVLRELSIGMIDLQGPDADPRS